MPPSILALRTAVRTAQIDQQQASLGIRTGRIGGFGVQIIAAAPVEGTPPAPPQPPAGVIVAGPSTPSPVQSPPAAGATQPTGGGGGDSPPPTLTQAERTLIGQLANANEKHLASIAKGATRGALVAIVILFLFVPRPWVWAPTSEGLLMVTAAAGLWVVVFAVGWLKRESGGLVRMLIGADGRFSTSAFQAWIWTLALTWAIVYFLLYGATQLTLLGAEKGQEAMAAFTHDLNADYLLLLGGPFAALIVAKQLKQSKVAAEQLQSVPAEQARLTDIVSSDSHRTDLVDTQYLLFNFVALAFFFGVFLADPTQLPDIPDSIIMLTSAAALGFVAAKAIQRNVPSIASVVKTVGAGSPTVGDIIRISGVNLVPPGGETVESQLPVRVLFGTVEGTPYLARQDSSSVSTGTLNPTTPPSLADDGMSRTAVDVLIPDLPVDGLTRRSVEIRVVTAAGIQTDPFPLTIEDPLPVSGLAYDTETRTLAFIVDDAPADTPLRVYIDASAPLTPFTSAGGSAEVAIPAGVTGVVHIEIHRGARHYSLEFRVSG